MNTTIFRSFSFTIRRIIVKDTSRYDNRSMADKVAHELDYFLKIKYKGTKYEDRIKE